MSKIFKAWYTLHRHEDKDSSSDTIFDVTGRRL